MCVAMCVYLLHIHTAAMIPTVAPMTTRRDTTTPATAPPTLLLLLSFPDDVEAVGWLEGVGITSTDDSIWVTDGVVSIVSVSKLLLVQLQQSHNIIMAV